jgi:uncharacterized damage-inducible protein DinB
MNTIGVVFQEPRHMADHPFAHGLRLQQEFFERGTASLTEVDSTFAPQAGLLSVAGHVAHAALTVEWFMAGAFSPSGFDLDFAAHEAQARAFTSLAAARARFAAAYGAAITTIDACSMADLQQPIAAGPIMGGAPRVALISAIGDHTAHHRGALAVYARLAGRVPAMPYA